VKGQEAIGLYRFSLDSSLGSLARWLRLLGHDAARNRGDNRPAALARCRAEERRLLTRSRDMPKLGLSWPPLGGLIIPSQILRDQLIQVGLRWPIFRDAALLSRCAECNERLVAIPVEEARRRVPPFVARTQAVFRTCPACGRIYWTGTHTSGIFTLLDDAAHAAGQSIPHRQ